MSSELVIEEVTGARKARLRLRGSGLPFMGGASWPVELRLVTKRYPGNALEGTQQVLGPTDMPSEFSGFWRRTLLGRVAQGYTQDGGSESLVNEPDRLWSIVDGIIRSGARLRVTWSADRPWDGTSFTVVREGRMKSFAPTPDRIGDIAWTMSFEWSGRGGAATKVDSAQSPASNAGADSMARIVDQMEEQYLRGPKNRTKDAANGASFNTLGQLEQFAAAPQVFVDTFFKNAKNAVDSLTRIGNLAKGLRGLPAGLAASAAGFALNTKDVANQFADDMTRVPPEESVLDQRVSAIVRGHTRNMRVVDESRRLGREATIIAERAARPRSTTEARSSAREANPETQVLAVHTVTAGDTAQGISRRYFRTPDNAAAIMKANGLPWHMVRPAIGTILQIPVLRADT